MPAGGSNMAIVRGAYAIAFHCKQCRQRFFMRFVPEGETAGLDPEKLLAVHHRLMPNTTHNCRSGLFGMAYMVGLDLRAGKAPGDV